MIKKHRRKSLKKRLEVNALVLPTLHKSTFFFSSHLSVGLRGFRCFQVVFFQLAGTYLNGGWRRRCLLQWGLNFLPDELMLPWSWLKAVKVVSVWYLLLVAQPMTTLFGGPLGLSGRQVARRVSRWASVQVSSPQLAELGLLGLLWSRNFVGTWWFLFWDRRSCFIVSHFNKN